MNFTELRACLEKDGWPIEGLSEVTLRSCFRGGGRMFPVFIHREPEHVTFAVIPFLRLPEVGATNAAGVVDRLVPGCVDPADNDREQSFLKALRAARAWQVEGDRLTLLDGAGAVLLRFATSP